MVDQLLHESLREKVRLQPQILSTARRHIYRSLGERIPDQAQQHELIAHQISRWDVERDVPLTEYLRLGDLDVLGNRIRFSEGHLEWWARGLFPLLIPVDRWTICRIVRRHGTADHLPNEPVGIEICSHCDRHIATDSLNLLRIPER